MVAGTPIQSVNVRKKDTTMAKPNTTPNAAPQTPATPPAEKKARKTGPRDLSARDRMLEAARLYGFYLSQDALKAGKIPDKAFIKAEIAKAIDTAF